MVDGSAPRRARAGAGVRLARAGDERSHRRPRLAERRDRRHRGSDERTSFAELSRSLRSIAQSLKLPLAVHLYSDMQQTRHAGELQRSAAECRTSIWSRTRIDAKEDPQFHGGKRGGAAARLRRQEDPRAGHHRRLSATQKATRNVSLVLNGRDDRDQAVEVPESGRATVEFTLARSALRTQQGRGAHRFRRLAAGRRQSSISRWSAPTRATPCSCTSRTATRGLLYLQDRAGSRRPIGLRDRSGDRGPDRQRHRPRKYAFVVLSRCGRAAGQFRRTSCASTCAAAASVLIALGHHSVAHAQGAGDRRPSFEEARYAGPRRRALPDGRVARSVAPFHSEGRPLGRREVLPGDPRDPGNARVAAG